MLAISKLNSTSFDNLQRRIVKVLRFGQNDVQSPIESAPYGHDANPVKDMVAVYGETREQGKTVIVGYINVNQLAEVGENRLYSTNSQGQLQTYIWLKANGDILLGGDADNSVRYSPLSSELTAFKNSLQTELVKIQTGLSGVGGVYTPGTLTIDISQAKIEEIKTL
jgi:hypothetical protein